MKPLEINTLGADFLHIDSVRNGIISEDCSQKGEAVGLKNCKNLIYKNGRLVTRPALSTTEESILDNSEFSEAPVNFRVTDIEFCFEGDTKRIVVENKFDYMSCYICLTHIVNSDGTYFKSIPIIFNRIDDDTFYIPDKINFFLGAPNNGSGIYCIAGTYNKENPVQKSSKLFELDASLTRWIQIYSTYVPTVLINGRGNKYEIAKNTGQCFTGTPTRLEGLNVINEDFHAYYSTDGFSSSFRLPFARLSSKRVLCRLYYSVENYVEWNISENQTTAVATLYNVNVTMHVNREKGIVFFTVPSGEYEMPLISDRNENNLRITASKDCEYSLTDIARADTVINYGGKILIAEGNKIFTADGGNPLYFPLQSVAKIGDNKPISAFATVGSSLFAFKENEVYKIALKKGESLNTTSLLADSDAVFYGGDSIDGSCINEKIGCTTKNAISSNNGLIMFYANDRKIYSLSPSGKAICVSGDVEITEFLQNIHADTVCAPFENGFIFACGNRALAVTYNTENPSLYYWEFPEETVILGAYLLNGITFAVLKHSYSRFAFIGKPDGTIDIWFEDTVANPTLKTSPVGTSLLTQEFSLGCDNLLKNINSVSLRLKGSNAVICLNERISFKASHLKSDRFSTVRLAPFLCGTDRLRIEVTSPTPLEIGCIDIKYTPLKF